MAKKKSIPASKRRGTHGVMGEDASRIKHDLRNELVIVREGISQVIDGLGAKDCGKCCDILKPALRHTDRLYAMIDELLSAPGYKTKRNDKKSDTVLTHSESHDFKKLKNEYIDRLAHLLRTPLSIANEALALVVEGIMGDLNPKQKDMIALLKKNMLRLNKSIEHILNTHRTMK